MRIKRRFLVLLGEPLEMVPEELRTFLEQAGEELLVVLVEKQHERWGFSWKSTWGGVRRALTLSEFTVEVGTFRPEAVLVCGGFPMEGEDLEGWIQSWYAQGPVVAFVSDGLKRLPLEVLEEAVRSWNQKHGRAEGEADCKGGFETILGPFARSGGWCLDEVEVLERVCRELEITWSIAWRGEKRSIKEQERVFYRRGWKVGSGKRFWKRGQRVSVFGFVDAVGWQAFLEEDVVEGGADVLFGKLPSTVEGAQGRGGERHIMRQLRERGYQVVFSEWHPRGVFLGELAWARLVEGPRPKLSRDTEGWIFAVSNGVLQRSMTPGVSRREGMRALFGEVVWSELHSIGKVGTLNVGGG